MLFQNCHNIVKLIPSFCGRAAHANDGIIRYQNRLSFVLDYAAQYEETSITALSANPAVALPLLTINSWILMQRNAFGGSVSFNQNWSEYRDGFGSAAGNDNYWLGLDKVYRLQQRSNLRLRIEVYFANRQD